MSIDATKEQFVTLLNDTINKIDAIDKETPWGEVEPEWWLQMMTLRRAAQQMIEGYHRRESDS